MGALTLYVRVRKRERGEEKGGGKGCRMTSKRRKLQKHTSKHTRERLPIKVINVSVPYKLELVFKYHEFL